MDAVEKSEQQQQQVAAKAHAQLRVAKEQEPGQGQVRVRKVASEAEVQERAAVQAEEAPWRLAREATANCCRARWAEGRATEERRVAATGKRAEEAAAGQWIESAVEEGRSTPEQQQQWSLKQRRAQEEASGCRWRIVPTVLWLLQQWLLPRERRRVGRSRRR